MTDFDLRNLLSGLSEEEAETLVNTLPGLLSAARNRIVSQRPKTGQERKAELAAELESVSSGEHFDQTRGKAILGELDGIEEQERQEQRLQAQAHQAKTAEKRAELEGKLSAAMERQEALMRAPNAWQDMQSNHKEIQELERELGEL
jgi:hypothetical protein